MTDEEMEIIREAARGIDRMIFEVLVKRPQAQKDRLYEDILLTAAELKGSLIALLFKNGDNTLLDESVKALGEFLQKLLFPPSEADESLLN